MRKIEKMTRIRKSLSTMQTIALGFLVVILTGSFLLSLPIASADGIATPYVDALFTSTTSVCVTGLVTVNSAMHWSMFGKFVILCLIQIGGLGFMTAVSMVFSFLKMKMSLRNRLSTQDSLSETGISSLGFTVKRVVFGTFIIEGIGALFITLSLTRYYEIWTSLKFGIFTAISAFCNAGIDIMSMDSLISFHHNGLLLSTVMGLIILGGIGFPVWWELLEAIREKIVQKRRWQRIGKHLSLHLKLVVLMTVLLILVGGLLTLIYEWNNPATMGHMNGWEKIQNAFFQSVTTRTAGFDALGQNMMHDSTKLSSMFLMFIGGSPGSTAGGIKTVTFAVIVLRLIIWIRGGDEVKIFKREISEKLIRKAFLIATLSAMLLFVSILILSTTESAGMFEIAYECVSALATVGLSLGLTPELTVIGKVVIMLLMFMGRIGPITMFLAMNRDTKPKSSVNFPEEKVLIG